MTVSKTWSIPWTTANFSLQEQRSLLCVCVCVCTNIPTFNGENLKLRRAGNQWRSHGDSFGDPTQKNWEFHSARATGIPKPRNISPAFNLISGRVSEIQDTMDGWGCFLKDPLSQIPAPGQSFPPETRAGSAGSSGNTSGYAVSGTNVAWHKQLQGCRRVPWWEVSAAWIAALLHGHLLK